MGAGEGVGGREAENIFFSGPGVSIVKVSACLGYNFDTSYTAG